MNEEFVNQVEEVQDVVVSGVLTTKQKAIGIGIGALVTGALVTGAVLMYTKVIGPKFRAYKAKRAEHVETTAETVE